MKSRHSFVLLVWVAVAFLVVGCALAKPTPTASPLPVGSPTAANPAPTLLSREITPKPDLGIVQGVLSTAGEPAAGHMLYLAPVIRSEGEGMGVAALDPVNDPRIESDATGYFCFVDVKPGTYALGIMGPTGAVLFRAADGEEIVVEVQGGQVLDLGTVEVTPFTQ